MSSLKSYDKLSDQEKKYTITKMYLEELKSFGDIAENLGTYANRIRRDAQKFKIPIRNKSEAQSNALKTGRTKHPTEGTERSDTTKSKIGLGLAKSWDSMDESTKQKIKEQKREQWNKLSDDQKANMQKSANDAVRLASKRGSKLEKYILEKLLKDGWRVDFHKEHMLVDTKLQIDLLVPSIKTAIEIDGPSHFVPVWGEDALKKNIKYDQKKQGLLVGKGYALIRVMQEFDFSKTRADIIYSRIHKVLKDISANFPEPADRIIIIKDQI